MDHTLLLHTPAMTFTFSKATRIALPHLTVNDIIQAVRALKGESIIYHLPRWWRFAAHMSKLP